MIWLGQLLIIIFIGHWSVVNILRMVRIKKNQYAKITNKLVFRDVKKKKHWNSLGRWCYGMVEKEEHGNSYVNYSDLIGTIARKICRIKQKAKTTTKIKKKSAIWPIRFFLFNFEIYVTIYYSETCWSSSVWASNQQYIKCVCSCVSLDYKINLIDREAYHRMIYHLIFARRWGKNIHHKNQ